MRWLRLIRCDSGRDAARIKQIGLHEDANGSGAVFVIGLNCAVLGALYFSLDIDGRRDCSDNLEVIMRTMLVMMMMMLMIVMMMVMIMMRMMMIRKESQYNPLLYMSRFQ